MTTAARDLVMAIFPNARGFAYSVFEGSVPIDWGTSDVRGAARNNLSLRRILKLLENYNPDVLLLRDHSDISLDRSGRVRSLAKAVADLAATRDLRVIHISRQQVRKAFNYLEHPTRYRIVRAISERIPFLDSLAPPPRKIWNSEDRRMGLFDATALVLTFLDQESSRFRDDE